MYSIVGTQENELNDMPTTIENKIDAEKVSVKVDMDKFKVNSTEVKVLCKKVFEELNWTFATSDGNLRQ